MQKWWGWGVHMTFCIILPFAAFLCLQEVYFHYMEPQARQAAVASASRGLCQASVTNGDEPFQMMNKTD